MRDKGPTKKEKQYQEKSQDRTDQGGAAIRSGAFLTSEGRTSGKLKGKKKGEKGCTGVICSDSQEVR